SSSSRMNTLIPFSSFVFFFSSRRRHTRFSRDWSSDVCSSDLADLDLAFVRFAYPLFVLQNLFGCQSCCFDLYYPFDLVSGLGLYFDLFDPAADLGCFVYPDFDCFDFDQDYFLIALLLMRNYNAFHHQLDYFSKHSYTLLQPHYNFFDSYRRYPYYEKYDVFLLLFGPFLTLVGRQQ